MNGKQKAGLVIAILLLTAMLLFPPWIHPEGSGVDIITRAVVQHGSSDAGYHFFLKPPSRDVRIDTARLLVQGIFIALITAGLLLLFRSSAIKNEMGYEMSRSQSSEPSGGSIDALPRRDEKNHKQIKGVGGWLLFFCISLTILNPLFMLGSIGNAFIEAKRYPEIYSDFRVMMIIDAILRTLLMMFGLYVGIDLWKVKPRAVKAAKDFLFLVLIYSFMQTLMMSAYLSVGQGIGRMIPVLIHVVIWSAYLNRSKRVRATYAIDNQETTSG